MMNNFVFKNTQVLGDRNGPRDAINYLRSVCILKIVSSNSSNMIETPGETPRADVKINNVSSA